jgi:Lon-like ATP-dependent protease
LLFLVLVCFVTYVTWGESAVQIALKMVKAAPRRSDSANEDGGAKEEGGEGSNSDDASPIELDSIEQMTVDGKDLVDYVGQPPFSSDKMYDTTPVGVTMGLAWTSMGGDTLYIEAAVVEQGEGKVSAVPDSSPSVIPAAPVPLHVGYDGVADGVA